MQNWGNDLLRARAALLKRVKVTALYPGCVADDAVAASAPPPASLPTVPPNWQLRRVPINISTAGDNTLISTLVGQKNIYEIFLWTAGGANSLALYQGPSATGILLLPWPGVPAQTGFVLGFNGNFKQPHWEVDAGNTLVLNLSAATQVTGFLVYAVPEVA